MGLGEAASVLLKATFNMPIVFSTYPIANQASWRVKAVMKIQV